MQGFVLSPHAKIYTKFVIKSFPQFDAEEDRTKSIRTKPIDELDFAL